MNIYPDINLSTETFAKVAIEFMNDTHFEEIEMVQNIGKSLQNYAQKSMPTDEDKKEITTLLNQWFEHTQTHFSRENTLMEQTSFPAYQIHSGEHEIVLQQMKDIFEDWSLNYNIDTILNYVFDIWPAWFEMHVTSMDMMTAQFAVDNGFSSKGRV